MNSRLITHQSKTGATSTKSKAFPSKDTFVAQNEDKHRKSGREEKIRSFHLKDSEVPLSTKIDPGQANRPFGGRRLLLPPAVPDPAEARGGAEAVVRGAPVLLGEERRREARVEVRIGVVIALVRRVGAELVVHEQAAGGGGAQGALDGGRRGAAAEDLEVAAVGLRAERRRLAAARRHLGHHRRGEVRGSSSSER